MFPDVSRSFSLEVTTQINPDAGVTVPSLGDTAELKEEGIA